MLILKIMKNMGWTMNNKNERYWMVEVNNWIDDYGKRKYSPVPFTTCKAALDFAAFVRDWDLRNGGHPRRIKVRSDIYE